MFLIDDLIGGAFDMLGQSSANAANRELQEDAQHFNSNQAAIARRFASEQASYQRNWASREALAARDFEERMSNSAYQRQVSDMQKAGLNPIMAAMKGGGASTPNASAPSGASASATSASSPSPTRMEALKIGEAVKNSISHAIDIKRMNKDLEEKDSVISLNKAAEKLKDTEATLTTNNASKVLVEKQKAEWDKLRSKFDAESAAQRARRELNESDISDANYDVEINKANFKREHKGAYYWSDMLGNVFGSSSKAAATFR